MFIRKKKVLKMLEALTEDAAFWQEHHLKKYPGLELVIQEGGPAYAYLKGEAEGYDRLKWYLFGRGFRPKLMKREGSK